MSKKYDLSAIQSSTTSITKDTWYKTNDSSVTLTYQNSGDGTVTARITDRSNNDSESSKDISVYKVTFNKGTADKIDGMCTEKYKDKIWIYWDGTSPDTNKTLVLKLKVTFTYDEYEY